MCADCSPVHGHVPYKEERVKKQQTREDLHEELPAGRSQLRQRGAPERVEERGGRQHRGEVLVQHPQETVEPAAERRRRTRTGSDPPRADPRTDAAQRVQREERCAEQHVSQEGEGRRQVRRQQDVLLTGSHGLPKALEEARVGLGMRCAHHGSQLSISGIFFQVSSRLGSS